MGAQRPATERVLVLPRERVPGGSDFRGVRVTGGNELAALRLAIAEHGRLLDRPLAEDDPRFKQLIPYVVLRDRGRVFVMRRSAAGGDARLHHRFSIGVGGHLDERDDGPDPLQAGLEREWREELVADWSPTFRLIGLLNDDSNPVGAVHLGVVFEVEAAGRQVAIRERDKLEGEFHELSDLADLWDALETWSQLTAEALIASGERAASGHG